MLRISSLCWLEKERWFPTLEEAGLGLASSSRNAWISYRLGSGFVFEDANKVGFR